jgi:4-amino-4-deoxy-L-arabinose transferase-like glycosyltransferase
VHRNCDHPNRAPCHGDAVVPGSTEHIYWQPPLYELMLAGWCRVFGVGLMTARAFSMVTSLATLALLYLIARRTAPRWACILAMTFLAIAIWFQRGSCIVRMDMLTLFWCALCWWIYNPEEHRLGLMRSILMGAAGGLAMLTHPLGVLAGMVIVLHRLITAPRSLLSLSAAAAILSAALVFAPWGLYILQDLEAFRLQMSQQLGRKDQHALIPLSLLVNLRNYVVFIAVLLAATSYVCLGIGRNRAWRFPAVIGLLLLLVPLLGAEDNYTIYIVAGMTLCLATALAAISWRRMAIAVCVIGLANHLALTGLRLWSARNLPSLSEVNARIRSVVPPGAPVFWWFSRWDLSPYFATLDRNPLRVLPPTPLIRRTDLRRELAAYPYVAVNEPDRIEDFVTQDRDVVLDIDYGRGRLYIYGPLKTSSTAGSRPARLE